MSIIFVVDSNVSALYTAACARTEVSGGSVIAANQFPSPTALLKYLIVENPCTVIFSWRQGLLDCVCSTRGRSLLNTLREKTVISVLIPDHQGLNSKFWEKEVITLAYCDFYMVTNHLLFKKYSELNPEFPPKRVLHDMPNRRLIEITRANHPRTFQSDLRVIWVGNSKWGNRQGFQDHKGFHSVVQPLKILLENCDSNIVLDVIDSGVSRISHEMVLQKIRNSDVLIQTSSSEGTGLPILEALGLETDVLTTDVGVASEILGEANKSKIIGDNPVEILTKLQEYSKPNPASLRDLYLSYCQLAASEIIPTVSRSTKASINQSSFGLMIQRYARWYFRFLLRQK